jgi:uncharacterized membrane protein
MIARFLTRLFLAAVFLTAGTLHLFYPGIFIQIMPPWVPFHYACVIISGVCELAGGVGLLNPQRRIQIASGWFLTLLLLAVLPANIYMATDHVAVNGKHFPSWILWLRLPLQGVLMAVVLWSTHAWSKICKKEVT